MAAANIPAALQMVIPPNTTAIIPFAPVSPAAVAALPPTDAQTVAADIYLRECKRLKDFSNQAIPTDAEYASALVYHHRTIAEKAGYGPGGVGIPNFNNANWQNVLTAAGSVAGNTATITANSAGITQLENAIAATNNAITALTNGPIAATNNAINALNAGPITANAAAITANAAAIATLSRQLDGVVASHNNRPRLITNRRVRDHLLPPNTPLQPLYKSIAGVPANYAVLLTAPIANLLGLPHVFPIAGAAPSNALNSLPPAGLFPGNVNALMNLTNNQLIALEIFYNTDFVGANAGERKNSFFAFITTE